MAKKTGKITERILQLSNGALMAAISVAGFPLSAGQPQPEYGVRVPQPLYGVQEPPLITPAPSEEVGVTMNIFGSVVEAKTNAPVSQSQIQLFADDDPIYLTVSDENGLFHILYRGLLEKTKEYRVKATPLDGSTKEKLAPADTVIKARGSRMESIKDSLVFKLSPAKSKKRK